MRRNMHLFFGVSFQNVDRRVQFACGSTFQEAAAVFMALSSFLPYWPCISISWHGVAATRVPSGHLASTMQHLVNSPRKNCLRLC